MTASAPPEVLVTTPFFLFSEYPECWNPRYDPMGGMHVLARSLVVEMAGRGHRQRVLTMAPPGVPKDLSIAPGVNVASRRLPVLPIPSRLEGYFGLVGAWGKAALLWAVRHRAELRRTVDVVHAHCDGSGSAPWYAERIARLLGVPLVLHLFSSRVLTQHPTTWFERVSDPFATAAERGAIQRAAAVLTLTDFARDRIRDELQVPAGRVHRLSYLTNDGFTDLDTPQRRAEVRQRFGLAQDRPVVLYLGRVAAEKGVEFFVEAAAQLAARRSCQFVIAGDGPQRAEIERLVAARGLRDSVVVTGFVAPELVPAIISCSTLAVLPSRYEELGLVILEIMTMRRPIVAHDVSGVDKFIRHKQTGLLAPPFDPPSLAAAVEELLDDPELGLRLASAAAEIPTAYTLAAAGAQLHEIYRDVSRNVSKEMP